MDRHPTIPDLERITRPGYRIANNTPIVWERLDYGGMSYRPTSPFQWFTQDTQPIDPPRDQPERDGDERRTPVPFLADRYPNAFYVNTSYGDIALIPSVGMMGVSVRVDGEPRGPVWVSRADWKKIVQFVYESFNVRINVANEQWNDPANMTRDEAMALIVDTAARHGLSVELIQGAANE